MSKFLFQSERLTMRPWTRVDEDAFHLIWGDAKVIWWRGSSFSWAQSRDGLSRVVQSCATMEHGLGWWLMQDKETGETIGNVLLQPFGIEEVEIGLQIVHRHWAHGFGTEAAAATLAYGFESLKIRRIVAVTHPQNQATKRILEKLVFQQDGFVMHKGFPHERYFKDREPSSEPAP